MNSVYRGFNYLCRSKCVMSRMCPQFSTQVLSIPTPEGEKVPSEKLNKIVKDISSLNLMEVSELSTLLRKTLNLPDTPMVAVGAAVAAAPQEDEQVEAPKAVKTDFTVKLIKYDDSKKVALIKEVKNLLEGMNLVQAKKFVESAPTVVKADIPKEEAEKLKEALTSVGAICEIE